MIDLYFLIPAVNAQIFNSVSELSMLSGTPTNEANTETQPLIAENTQSNLKLYTLLYAICSSNHCFISSKGWFLVLLILV